MTDHSTPNRIHLRERLRDKLPEILIEAASVVIALLLALAINEWRDHQQELERAAGARNAILAELRQNRQELETARPKLKAIVASLQDALDERKPDVHELRVDLGISLLSAAAWHAALATQASQRIDFAWMTRVAKVYELQENFVRVQNAAIDQLAAISPDSTASGKQVAQTLITRFSALSQIGEGLANGYAEVLAEPAR